ncbi:unnamed protein product [Prunus armeniaca]|uniref:Uncharacterized protein n=1 Tax=Prunus armeniaca TaxID=36596 RepID=A0A6J5TSZ2_PRUAR|nr:unnamed protein product [Prunus armeniaca]
MAAINTEPEQEPKKKAMKKKNPTAIEEVVLGKGNTTTCCNKPEIAFVSPAKRRTVKRMMFDSFVHYVSSSLSCICDDPVGSVEPKKEKVQIPK